MSQNIAANGPVSKALEVELRRCVHRHGIVFWLDQAGAYTGLVDQLREAWGRGEVPYEVAAYRGSYLELLCALEKSACGLQKGPLVVHVPHHTEEELGQTPLLELRLAGVEFGRSLGTLEALVTRAAAGRVSPDKIEAWKALPVRSLEQADAWLSSLLGDLGGGVAAHLRAMPLEAIMDDLLSGGWVARVGLVSDEEALWSHLGVVVGLSQQWRGVTRAGGEGRAELGFALASWALCVEFVEDLRRAPTQELLRGMSGLPEPLVEACRGLAQHLRARHPAFYRRTADETEALLVDEIAAAQAEDLGEVDTFRFEEDKVLRAALRALGEGKWSVASRWYERRMEHKEGRASFWLQDNPMRHSAWSLIGHAARLGELIAEAGPRLGTHESLEDALRAYQERGARVDQAHRHLEQSRAALLYPQLPNFEELRARLDALRGAWRAWADAWAKDLSGLYRQLGFLPSASYQQRTIFEEVIRPLALETREITACFVVDALRYEMAEELKRHIEATPATLVNLKARLSELPSVTAVGMNALAPVASQGRLRPVMVDGQIEGFLAGSYQVRDPASRKRAMHDRVGGHTCPLYSLEEVVGLEIQRLKNGIKSATLVVIHSQEIDSAGENGVGPAVFDTIMRKLRAAWHLLREAGVRRFVFTADHGFLLLDDLAPVVQPHGRRVDPKRRHVFSPVAANHAGEVRASLMELGYEGTEWHVMFPEGVALFDTGRRFGGFVHGGSSFQERAIPVLTVVHRAPTGGRADHYQLSAEPREGVGGMHCVSCRVQVAEDSPPTLMGASEVEVALRAEDAEVQVELCQTRGGARLEGGTAWARVGEVFEVFFRLTGSSDARALVELYHPSVQWEVRPYQVQTRFEVTRRRTTPPPEDKPSAPSASGRAWLEQLGGDPGVRHFFEHLDTHGTVTEAEAANMLGGPRAVRRFSIMYDDLIKKLPFRVKIDHVSGVKRYIKEGRI